MNDNTPETPRVVVNLPFKPSPMAEDSILSDSTKQANLPATEVVETIVTMPYLTYRKIEEHLRQHATDGVTCNFYLGEAGNPDASHPMSLAGAMLRRIADAAKPSAARGDKQIRLKVLREVDLQPGVIAGRPFARKVRAVKFAPV